MGETQDQCSHGSVRHVHPNYHPMISEKLLGTGRIARFDDNIKKTKISAAMEAWDTSIPAIIP